MGIPRARHGIHFAADVLMLEFLPLFPGEKVFGGKEPLLNGIHLCLVEL